MTRLTLGVTRYASVAAAIEARLALGAQAACRIGQGRVYVTLRGAQATRWPAETQVARALEIAQVAREVLAAHRHALVRRHARHAVVVRYEDWAHAPGGQIHTQSECVVPVPSELTPLESFSARGRV